MLIEINEREATLIRAACHTSYMGYKYGKKVAYLGREKADTIAEEYWNIHNKMDEALYGKKEEK